MASAPPNLPQDSWLGRVLRLRKEKAPPHPAPVRRSPNPPPIKESAPAQNDVRTTFSRATELHRQGRFEEAIALYRGLVQAQPARLDIQRLLTFALLQAGQAKEAMACARHACETHPARPEAHLLVGAVQQVRRDWLGALETYESVRQMDPSCGEASYLAGKVLASLGRHAEALERYTQALELDPAATDARIHRARAFARLGREAEALEDCDRLVAAQPKQVSHLLLKGGILLDAGRHEQALAVADEALALSPRLFEAHFLRGQGLEGLGAYEEARNAFNMALSCAPQRYEVLARLAGLERRRHQPGFSAALCDIALALDPENIDVHYERAAARRELGQLCEALDDIEAVLKHVPDEVQVLALKSQLLLDLGQVDEARTCMDAAFLADPSAPFIQYLRARDNLARQNWNEGWAGFESRLPFAPLSHEALPFSRWNGLDRPGDLIVVGEASLSEMLLFARLLRTLCDQGLRVRLLVPPEHMALLRRVDARVQVISDISQIDPLTPGLFWVPMGSLPGLISPDPAGWPRPPYLPVDSERVVRWRYLQEDAPEKLRIGICWTDDAARPESAGRSIPLSAFAPLAQMQDVQLISLQAGPGAAELDHVPFADRIIRLDPRRDADGAFIDTSAILQHLDLVVTGDLALSHLAGARGRSVFTALRIAPRWYWGYEGAHTPFYPDMTLFRQSRVGEWGDVFAHIAESVTIRLDERRAAAQAIISSS